MNRVQLRDVIDSDVPIFFDHQNDEAANYMAAFPPRDQSAFTTHWAKIRHDPAVILKTILFEDEVVGHVASFDRAGDREVAYWIAREHWGKGLATAALSALLELDPKRPLIGRVVTDNIGSLRVLEKCGFVASGTEKMFAESRGAEIEEVIMKLA